MNWVGQYDNWWSPNIDCMVRLLPGGGSLLRASVIRTG
jgi:hypothetical protein